MGAQMDQVKKIVFFSIPLSICNFRCHYCYLAQRPEHYLGVQPEMKYTPQQVALAMSPKRLGGLAYFNFCADGETLLLKDLDKYVFELVKEGHYVEIITNMTIDNMLDKIIAFPKEYLSHIEFKCSFHYLELKKRKLLEKFTRNVKRAHRAGASITIEVTPTDELIPYIDELKEFSINSFGALPHLTIARDDRTEGIEKLTNLSEKEYKKTWGQFHSSFWEFKESIFGVKQTDFCYAGAWSLYINLSNGIASQCYCGHVLGDVFATPDKPLPCLAVGKCTLPHCYNGHAFMAWGLIPDHYQNVYYGDLRDRVTKNGDHWLQTRLNSFFHTKLSSTNKEYSLEKKKLNGVSNIIDEAKTLTWRVPNKIKRVIGVDK